MGYLTREGSRQTTGEETWSKATHREERAEGVMDSGLCMESDNLSDKF